MASDFHEVRFPLDVSLGSRGGPVRRTDIVTLSSGREHRNSRWAHSRRRYDAGLGVRSIDALHSVIAFFEERRGRKQPPLQRVLRALLGIDAKMSQYTRGKAFVDHVVQRVGMTRFNTIWSGPETLPLPTEIEEPQRWIDRVL